MKLITVHATTVVSTCPNKGVDVYVMEFTVINRTLEVEHIQSTIDALVRAPIFQEALTRALACQLDCRVESRGSHGRFDTRCVATPDTWIE